MRKIVRQATFRHDRDRKRRHLALHHLRPLPPALPPGVSQIESGVALRRIATEYGVFPTARSSPSAPHQRQPDRRRQSAAKSRNRAKWAEGLGVKPFSEEMEILYFPGCYLSFDPRLKKVAQATAKILNAAGVDYGILGAKENCCGESIRKTGDEELFKRLARENIKTFIDNGVKKILVSSPHCYHTFKNEYPEFMVQFEVVHITQFLFELIEEGRLS
jgi:Fe-S oxidoreductase